MSQHKSVADAFILMFPRSSAARAASKGGRRYGRYDFFPGSCDLPDALSNHLHGLTRFIKVG